MAGCSHCTIQTSILSSLVIGPVVDYFTLQQLYFYFGSEMTGEKTTSDCKLDALKFSCFINGNLLVFVLYTYTV